MLMSMMIFILSLLISMMMMLGASILSKKTFMDREKNSPFECGFDPKNSKRLPFSLQFFMISIIFLIFDVEIALILPIIPIINFSFYNEWIITSTIFIIILIIGIYHEWNQGALKWY